MSQEKKNVCLFDNDKQCPVRTAIDIHTTTLLEQACTICPIRAELMKGKGSFGSMD